MLGLGLSERLQRSLATTNAIESLLSRTRHVQRHVKRWRGGTMVLRWVAAGVLEAAKGFRRVKGCQDMLAPSPPSGRVTRGWVSGNRQRWSRSREEPPLNFNSARDIPNQVLRKPVPTAESPAGA